VLLDVELTGADIEFFTINRVYHVVFTFGPNKKHNGEYRLRSVLHGWSVNNSGLTLPMEDPHDRSKGNRLDHSKATTALKFSKILG